MKKQEEKKEILMKQISLKEEKTKKALANELKK